ncbi:hypothetical protein B0A55_03267 [Friedmanniomyces simplex]|uniref:Zinc-ribbon 15 domain-containing protein n=1 Tax=Friedmanniomyces simplex TaxID=329884 RepID=A0A4V5NH98_9PEZI|nr:hypothetical protein B0A55_03267 [Friedmanniomyces simplex]
MACFIFTCGTHNFRSLLAGYENVTVQCQNCGNFSGNIVKNWEWFTFCFVPLIPFSLKPWHAVHCNVCQFQQDVKYRPDVEQQMQQAGGGGAAQAIPMQNQGANQGWNRPPPPPPPGQGGAVPQYK